jgi:hypothetical protein
VDLNPLGTIHFTLGEERPGMTELQISCVTVYAEPLSVRSMVVTSSRNGSPPQTLAIDRSDRHQFTTRIHLERGVNRITVIARTETDARLRATLELKVPNGG